MDIKYRLSKPETFFTCMNECNAAVCAGLRITLVFPSGSDKSSFFAENAFFLLRDARGLWSVLHEKSGVSVCSERGKSSAAAKFVDMVADEKGFEKLVRSVKSYCTDSNEDWVSFCTKRAVAIVTGVKADLTVYDPVKRPPWNECMDPKLELGPVRVFWYFDKDEAYKPGSKLETFFKTSYGWELSGLREAGLGGDCRFFMRHDKGVPKPIRYIVYVYELGMPVAWGESRREAAEEAVKALRRFTDWDAIFQENWDDPKNKEFRDMRELKERRMERSERK